MHHHKTMSNPKTFVTLSEDQTISPGGSVPLDVQVLRDDDLSFQDGGFVAKESGDYRVTGMQRLSHFEGDGKVQLQVGDYILDLQGNNSQFLSGSRVIALKAGDKLVPSMQITGTEDVIALADPVKSEIVFERA